MFWGLIMEPQRRYTQQVKKAFHISMAALDLSTSSDEPAQVMCGFEGRNYLLCTLKKPNMLQCPLDLNFEIGDEVSFAANGKCYVHLTGYLIDQPLKDDEEEEEEEEEEQENEVEVPLKTRKRNKKLLENGPPTKKPKGSAVSSSQNEEDSDSDSDLSVKDLLGKSFDSDDDDDSDVVEDGEEGEEEEDADDVEEEEDGEGEEAEEEDESDSSSDNEEEEDEEEVSKPKVNGIPKKQKVDKKKKQKHIEEVKKSPKNEQKKDAKTPNKENKTPKKKTLTGGVVVEDIKEGDGPLAKNGRFVTVYYEGRLKHNNKMFDSTSQGTGFGFRLGGNEVIKGWNIGIAGMKVGGKRRFVCPPEMAYGKAGSHPTIPPNASLVFDVELRKVS